jgi:hypothetical protein
MKKSLPWLVIVIVAFASGGVLGRFVLGRPEPPVAQSIGTSQSYFNTLRLDTPEGAVREFLRAWESDDLVTMYLLLAVETQYTIHVQFHIGQPEHLVPDQSKIQDELKGLDWSDLAMFDHSPAEGLGIFCTFAGAAKETDSLPINLDPPTEILNSEQVATDGDRSFVDVLVKCPSHSLLTIRTIQSKSGPWRILYVILPDEEPSTWPTASDSKFLPQPNHRG